MLRNNKGMTLLEIMIVLAILGGLVAALVSTLTGRLDKARIDEAKIQISEVGKQLDMFYTDCGFYPTTEQGLKALVEPPTSEPTCNEWGPSQYMKKVPKDPWNNQYYYENQGGSYVIVSLGGDRREGGDGVNADISSENL